MIGSRETTLSDTDRTRSPPNTADKQQKKTYNIDQAVCQIAADVVGKAAYTQRLVNFAVIILQKRIL